MAEKPVKKKVATTKKTVDDKKTAVSTKKSAAVPVKSSIIDKSVVAEFRANKHVTVDVLAKATGLSTRRIQQLKQDGGFVTEETTMGRRYLLLESLIGFIKYLMKNQDSADIAKETKKADLRLKKAKAKVVENELRILEGESHRAEHVRQIFSYMITETKSALKGLPGRCAVSCSGTTPTEASEILKNEIHSVLDRMCHLDYDPEKFSDMVKEDGGTSTFGLEEDKDDK